MSAVQKLAQFCVQATSNLVLCRLTILITCASLKLSLQLYTMHYIQHRIAEKHFYSVKICTDKRNLSTKQLATSDSVYTTFL